MNYVQEGWVTIKNNLNDINDLYTLDETIELLKRDDFYKNLFGKAKNRTLIKDNPKLYKSIYEHTKILEVTLKKYKRYKGWYNFTYRMKFLVEHNANINELKCECGRTYTWNTLCRYCPADRANAKGRIHTDESKRKMRVAALRHIKQQKGQTSPHYNIKSIPIIEQYGKDNGYNFQHAENGGEYHIKDLGYFLDGYDVNKNVVLEIDEPHHFIQGVLRDKDVQRQNEIESYLGCKFIRIKYEKK